LKAAASEGAGWCFHPQCAQRPPVSVVPSKAKLSVFSASIPFWHDGNGARTEFLSGTRVVQFVPKDPKSPWPLAADALIGARFFSIAFGGGAEGGNNGHCCGAFPVQWKAPNVRSMRNTHYFRPANSSMKAVSSFPFPSAFI